MSMSQPEYGANKRNEERTFEVDVERDAGEDDRERSGAEDRSPALEPVKEAVHRGVPEAHLHVLGIRVERHRRVSHRNFDRHRYAVRGVLSERRIRTPRSPRLVIVVVVALLLLLGALRHRDRDIVRTVELGIDRQPDELELTRQELFPRDVLDVLVLLY